MSMDHFISAKKLIQNLTFYLISFDLKRITIYKLNKLLLINSNIFISLNSNFLNILNSSIL